MSFNICCIPGCKSRSPQTKLVRIPQAKELIEAWTKILHHRYPSLQLNFDKKGHSTSSVCVLHFEENSFDLFGRRNHYAVPTLFSEREILEKVPDQPISVDIANTCKRTRSSVEHDHPYIKTKKAKVLIGAEEIVSLPSSSIAPTPVAGPSAAGHRIEGAEANVPLPSEANVPLPSSSIAPTMTAGPRAAPQRLDGAVANVPLPSPSIAPTPIAGSSAASHRLHGTNSSRRRIRIVKSVQTLTPRCKKMYHKCLGIIKSKKRLLTHFEDRLKKAQDLSEQQSFKSMIEQLPRHSQTFMWMQLDQANKHIKRRRYTTEQKLLALTLLKQSPKGYKLLQKLFILPTRRTLSSFTQEFKMAPGINANVLKQLTETVKTWDTKKRACAIVFDEIALTPHLTFVESEDAITGFVNFGQGSQMKMCDHSLVFMVRGICSSWRQMVAFYFCEGTTPALTLKNILRDVVEGISQTGLLPMALVCDQGSTFQTCLRSFQEDTRRGQLINEEPEGHKINIGGHKLNIIYDPPHLIKGIRNNMLTKDLSFNGKTARWNDILEVYDADCQLGSIRLLNKLTEEHVRPTMSQRMKVKTCTQVLSERTAAMLTYTSRYETHADGRPVSQTMKNTAEAVLFFDRLFDSVNGSRRGAAQPGKLRGPVKEVGGGSKHVSFWVEAIGILEKSFFFESTPQGHITKKWVPTIGNWITTLKSFIDLWSDLKEIGVTYLYTRNLNQDPPENFFGRLRALNHRSNQPDAYAFQCSFKSLLITNTLGPHSPHSNCEDDMGALLFVLQKDNDSADVNVTDQSPQLGGAATSNARRVSAPAPTPSPSGQGRSDLFRQARTEKISTHAHAYVAGYVSRKILAKSKCRSCRRSFLTADVLNEHEWIRHRERSLLRGRNLLYPNSRFIRLLISLIEVINNYMDKFPHRPDILTNIETEFLKTAVVDGFGCPQHHAEALAHFIKLVCRIQIHNICTTVNKILRGSFENRINTSAALQKLAFEKRKKISKKNIRK